MALRLLLIFAMHDSHSKLLAERSELRDAVDSINRSIIALADQYVAAWRIRKVKEERIAMIDRLLLSSETAEPVLESVVSPHSEVYCA